MTRPTETDLMLLRLLRGELSPEAANRLRERMLREPELAAAWRRLETGWQSLELPPPSPVPVGFSTRVLAHARKSAASPSWSAAPVWIRATAAAALVTGVVLGAGIGTLRPPTPAAPAAPAPAARAIPATPKTTTPRTTTTATTTTTPGAAPTPTAEPAAPPAATPSAEPTPAPSTEEAGAAETAEPVAELDFGGDLVATYWQDVASATESSDGTSEPDAAATPNGILP